MADVSVVGLDELDSWLVGVQKQIPFAAAKALTATAKKAQSKVITSMDAYIDRPTPFTKKGTAVTWATKSKLQSKVKLKPIQEAYLRYQIEGGIRIPKRTAIVVPVNVRLNKYGNMTRAQISNLLAKSTTFSGVIQGVAGIWERTSRGLVLRVAYEPEVSYEKAFPFWTIGMKEGQRVWKAEFDKALTKALETAR